MLPPALVKQFEGKQIVCIEYDSLDQEDEREVFQVIYSYSSEGGANKDIRIESAIGCCAYYSR